MATDTLPGIDLDVEQLAEKIGIPPESTGQENLSRPLATSQYAYMAGVVDHRSNLVITVGKGSNRRIGYRVAVECRIKTERSEAVSFFETFFEEHNLPVRQLTHDDQTYTSHEFVLGRRDAVQRFLSLVRPYIIARQSAIDLLCGYILPALEAGAHQEKASFLELIVAVDTFREVVGRGNRSKYDYEYFAEEWGMTATLASAADQE